MKSKSQAASTPQPPPNKGERVIVDEVIEDLKARKEFGIERYGTPLMSHNGRNALVDAYQEALDLCCYLKQALIEARPEEDKVCGCHVDYMNLKVKKWDWCIHNNCVKDYGKSDDCEHAKYVTQKEDCEHWKEVADFKYYEPINERE